MIHTYTYKKLTWVDLENPTIEEVRDIMEKYDVHPLVAQELLSPNIKAKVDVYPNNIYLILHFPRFKSDVPEGAPNQEIDFVIGQDFIITAHYDIIDPLHNFSKSFEVNSILDKSDIGDHAGFIFYYMIRSLYRSQSDDLESIRSTLMEAENKIFHGKEREMVYRLSLINRDILKFKDAISLHKEVLTSFETAGVKFFGQKFDYHLRDILGEYYKVQTALQTNKEFLEELRRTNDSLLTTKQNETMKVLTMMAFVTFPLTLLSSILAIPSRYNPIVGREGDFWIIIALMALLTCAFLVFFKFKKWL